MRNSGRGKGRGGGNFGRGRGGRGSYKFSSNSNNKPKTKLEDCVFHLGTARQASDYDKCKDFIINYVKQEYSPHTAALVAMNYYIFPLEESSLVPKSPRFPLLNQLLMLSMPWQIQMVPPLV